MKNKKIIIIVAVVLVVIFGVIFIPKTLHRCDDCGKIFVGTGYSPNIIEDMVSDEEQIICKDCAEEQHAIAVAFGKSLDDFKYDLF